ncbi:MAG: DUF1580 domain-containing protein [Planctomycetota bacterium]
MAISLQDKLLSLTQASQSLPGRPHVSTLWRWYKRGVRGVRLETIVIAGRRYTSLAALEDFAAASTSAANGLAAGPMPTPRQRQAAIARVERELAEGGLTVTTHSKVRGDCK